MRCVLFHYLSLLSMFIPNLRISPTFFLIYLFFSNIISYGNTTQLDFVSAWAGTVLYLYCILTSYRRTVSLLETRRRSLCRHLPLSTDYPALLTFATSSNSQVVLEFEVKHEAFLYDSHTCGNRSENISVPWWVDSTAVQSDSLWQVLTPQCKCRIHLLGW